MRRGRFTEPAFECLGLTGRGLVVDSPFEFHPPLGPRLVADHLRVDAGQIKVVGAFLATDRDDHLVLLFARAGLHDRSSC